MTSAIFFYLLLLPMVQEPSISDFHQFLPLEIKEITNENTLKEEILHEESYVHPDFPGEELKVLNVRYFSHTWRNGDWHGRVKIYIPEKILKENLGLRP